VIRAAGAVALAALVTGCAGSSPLLHPAHALKGGDVRAMAGLSGNALVGGAAASIRDASNAAAQNGSQPVASNAYSDGVLADVAIAPGIAPFAGARVGVGSDVEGGIVYTGRGARLDLRKAFPMGKQDRFALSLGAAFRAAFLGRGSESLPGVPTNGLFGYGFDVPVLFGWRSAASLYQIWGGLRAGFDHYAIEPRSTEPVTGAPDLPGRLSANRVFAGGVVGIALGFRFIHVALELDAQFESVWGTFGGVSGAVQGATLVPASALWIDF
jgi:hypothetical protein